MKCRLFTTAMFVLAAVVSMMMVTQASAELLMDSTNFLYKYEMDVTPNTQDLDNNGAADFTYGTSGTGDASVNNGILSIVSTGSNTMAFYEAANTNQIWVNNISFTTGWTLEFSAWTPSSDTMTPFQVHFRPVGTTQYGTFFMKAVGEYWKSGTTDITLSTTDVNNAANVFNVFRIAQLPNTNSISVWRNGILLSNSLTYGGSLASPDFYFGDGSSTTRGTTYVDYLRLTPGAYAPIPEPSSAAMFVSALFGILAYAWRRIK